MERDELFAYISKLEEDMKNMQQDLQTLKEAAVKLVEENVSLQMEKENYEEVLKKESDSSEGFKQNTLRNLYEEGFHVCSVHFGTHRHGADCLFCQGFLENRGD